MSPVLFTVHLLGCTSFAYAIYYDLYELEFPDSIKSTRGTFGGQAKFLTFLNMCLQFVFFAICILVDLTGQKSSLKKVKDVMFASAAFPIGVFVACIFWGLYAVDRELIFPVRFDGYFPVWLNHLMHTTVLPLQFGELFLSSHVYPCRALGLGIFSALTVGYLIWIHVIFNVSGIWVYPVFKVFDSTTRPIFMAFCVLVGIVFYFLGEILNSVVWKNNAQPTDAKKVRKEK